MIHLSAAFDADEALFQLCVKVNLCREEHRVER